MKFKVYMEKLKAKPVPWAKSKGLSGSTVWRILNEKTFPDQSTIRAIEQATGGAVKPIDWFRP